MADNLAILDGAAASRTVRAIDNAGVHTMAHTVLDGDNVALGAKADAAAGSDTGTHTLISLFKRLLSRFVTGTTIGAVEQAGTWNIGTVATITNTVGVDDNGGSLTVDGTFWQATQPTSLAALPALVAGTAVVGGVFAANGFAASENIYSATVLASAAGASKNHLSIFNADATLKVDILQVYVTKEMTAAVTGLVRGHRLFRFTTVHSAGTTPTARKLDTTMTDLDADVTVRAASTVTGAETEPLAAIGVGEEETATTAGRQTVFDHRETNRPITLNQNQGVTLQQDATAGTGLVSVVILFRVR
jgi:hypothetical protein